MAMSKATLLWCSVVLLMAVPSSFAIFIGGEQDVGSPLRVAQCRATCLERFSNDGPNGESMCLQGPDCFMCWENCELLQSNFQVWGAMCEEKEICFPGCQEACHFHAEASTNIQQTQPVIHTKGEGVIRVFGALARWPRPSSVGLTTPLVYVVMRKSLSGPWRQIIQTLDLTTRVPLNSDQAGSMLRVLVVDPQGLVTIYSPDEQSVRENRKKKKMINTEIKATAAFRKETPWTLKEVSLIHQKVLVIGEISWEPRSMRGVYLVTWEVDGGGLKGNLFTDSTCVTLSLWPDTVYHIQVELVSRTPGVDNLKSEMMDLDTGRAQKVSTESQEDLNQMMPGGGDGENRVDFNSPLLSVLVSAVRGEKSRHRWHNVELVMGSCAAIVLFVILLAIAFWRCRRRNGGTLENLIIGSSSVRRHKLVEDFSGYAGIQPIMTVIGTVHENTSSHQTSNSTLSQTRDMTAPPSVTFSGTSQLSRSSVTSHQSFNNTSNNSSANNKDLDKSRDVQV